MRPCVPLLLLGLIMGCAPTASIVRERNLSFEQVFERVRERNEKISTLRGEGTITIEGPESSNSGSFDLNLRKPDSLRVEFSGPFGIRVGTLMLSRSQFIFYNSLEHRAIVGTPDGTSFSSLFNLKLQFDEILRAFTGEFPSTSTNDSLVRFTSDQEGYLAVFKSGELTREYRIDGDIPVVTSYRLLDASGAALVTAMASESDLEGKVTMPMLIRVIFPKERRSISVAYDEVEVNEPVVCAFQIPDQAQIIRR